MKNVTSVFVFLILLLASCTEENIKTISDQESSSSPTRLVANYNQKLSAHFGNQIPASKAGLSAKGILETEILKDENEEPFLSMVFKEYDIERNLVNARLFNFGMGNEPVELPAKLVQAQINFLGNQLIIEDASKGILINLFVEVEANKTPAIETIRGNYLASEILPLNEEAISRAGGACSCDCEAVFVQKSSSCSCTCGGHGCSITCVGSRDAVCGSGDADCNAQ